MKKLDTDLLKNLIQTSDFDARDEMVDKWISEANAEIRNLKIEGDANLIEEVAKGNKFFNMRVWTDMTPGIVTKVISERAIEVAEMDYSPNWKNINSMSENRQGIQDWICYLSENPSKRIFTLRKNGMWVEKGQSSKYGYKGKFSSAPRAYYDWEF